MKIIGLAFVSLVWTLLSLTVKAEPRKIQLAQSSIPPQPPPLIFPPASPSLSAPVSIPPLPQPPTTFLVPPNKLLFGGLEGIVRVPATTEPLAAADQTFEAIWQQAFALEEDSPQFSTQVQNLLQSLSSIQQQYQANGERWGELKMLEVSLKLHYLICQDQQTLSITQKGVAIAAATDDSDVIKEWSKILTQIYWAMGETDLALETQQQMLNSLRTPSGELGFLEAMDLIELGDFYRLVKRYDEAIEAYIDAFKSASRPSRERLYLDVYYAGGHTFKQTAIEKLISLYEPLGNAEQVEYWIQQKEQANQIYEQLSRASDLLWGRLIEDRAEDISPAEKKPMVEEALEIFGQLGYPWEESDALAILSEVNLALQNYSEAISTGEAALEMIKTLQDMRSRESLVQTLVQAYLAVGQDHKAQEIQQDYEQFLARQRSARLSRPRFGYGFTPGWNEVLPVLHQQRGCFEKS